MTNEKGIINQAHQSHSGKLWESGDAVHWLCPVERDRMAVNRLAHCRSDWRSKKDIGQLFIATAAASPLISECRTA